MTSRPFILEPPRYPARLRVVGEMITVLASGAVTGGYEIFLQEGVEGPGPEPHHHPWDESFFVLRGAVDFEVETEVTRVAETGPPVHVPAGRTHTFRWRAGGGAMLSITSREVASKMFADIDAASSAGRPSRDTMNEICGRYGCT